MSAVVELEPPLVVEAVASRWEWWARLLGPVVVAACAVSAYANSFTVPFVFDGENYLLNAEHIRTLWPLSASYANAPTRPVGYVSFALNYALAGYEVRSWHITNLAIHIVAAWAVAGIVRRALSSRRLAAQFGGVAARLAWAVALVWVVHPLNTQSVTYLYQRLESLMGMFYLLTLYTFLRYADSGRWAWAVASLVCSLLAMGTKEVAVTAPLMVLWYDRAFLADSWGELWRRRGLMHVALFATLAWPAWLIHGALDVYPNAGILDVRRITPLEYACTQPAVVQHYLRLALVPWPLNIDYAWAPASGWRQIVPPAVVIGTLLVLTTMAVFKRPALGFLGAWWFVILAPTSSIAPIIDLAFEHRTYLSLIAVVALVVVGGYAGLGRLVGWWGGTPRVAAACQVALLSIVVASCTTLTLLRNRDYRSPLALWTDVVTKAPENPRAHYNHGVYLQSLGTNEGIDAACEEYDETIRRMPSYLDAYLNLGNIALWRKQYGEAISHFEGGLRHDPHHPRLLLGEAEAWKGAERPDRARSLLERLLAVEPENAEGRRLLDELIAAATAAGTAVPQPVPRATPQP
jgi:hypothetical protein